MCFFLTYSHRGDNSQQVQHIYKRLSADRDDCAEIGTAQGRTTVEVCRSVLLRHDGPHDHRYCTF